MRERRHRFLSILQYPVAESNLEDMIQDIEENEQSAQSHRIALKRLFTCLAHAVQYIHEELVRHKDIKPQNILVRRLSGTGNLTQVYLTDFGISTIYESEENVKSSGRPHAFTHRYAAPEVLSKELRGFPADIFSLGCVFLEMQTAVLGSAYHHLTRSFREERRVYSNVQDSVHIDLWIQQLERHPRSLDGLQISPQETRSRMRTVRAMLSIDPSERPTAVDVALRFGSNECCNLDREDFREDGQSQ